MPPKCKPGASATKGKMISKRIGAGRIPRPLRRSMSPTHPLNPPRRSPSELTNKALIDSLDEVKEHFEQPQNSVNIIITGRRTDDGSGQPKGVNKTTLASIMARDLDVAHFIKLVPVEERPKGLANAGVPSGVLFDAATGKSSIVTESTINYEKQFPDLQTLINGFTVYSAI